MQDGKSTRNQIFNLIHSTFVFFLSAEDYRFSDYFWEETNGCHLYFPERQVIDHLENPVASENACGNGFHIYNQTQCVMGNFSLAPQQADWCPPVGFHVKSCYIDCGSGTNFYFSRVI